MANIDKNKRNEKMFEAVILGESLNSVADACGITGSRVRQVIQNMRRMMLHPKRLGADVCPDHDYWKLSELRRFDNFWLAQLKKWQIEHDSNT